MKYKYRPLIVNLVMWTVLLACQTGLLGMTVVGVSAVKFHQHPLFYSLLLTLAVGTYVLIHYTLYDRYIRRDLGRWWREHKRNIFLIRGKK